MLHQGTKRTTRKQSAIQQLSNCFPVGSVFSSATVILLGGIVGALAYLESSAANADKLLEETSFVFQGLSGGAPWSWLIRNPWWWVPGGRLMRGLGISVIS